MTLYDFNILTLEEKQTTVWNNGTFLDNYTTKVKGTVLLGLVYVVVVIVVYLIYTLLK